MRDFDPHRIIINNVRMRMELTGETVEQALGRVILDIGTAAREVLARKDWRALTEQQAEEYRDVLLVISDIKNGFKSPTKGDIRDWIIAEAATQQLPQGEG